MSKKRNPKFSLTRLLWTMADIEYIDTLASAYANSNNRSRTRTTISLLAAILLAGITWWAAYYGDILPSYRWVQNVAAIISPDFDMARDGVAWMLFLFSLVPNLLEFGSVGLAVRGSIPVKLSIFVSMVFDMLTDGPTAYAWSHAMIVAALSGIHDIPIWVQRPLELILGTPMLFIFSAGLEILALTFTLTAWRLLLVYFSISTVRRSERAARGTTRRAPRASARTYQRPPVEYEDVAEATTL